MSLIAARAALPPLDMLQLRDGTVVTVRPADPGDGDMIQAYIRGLSPESRRNRFLGALNEISSAELERMTHSDDRQLTLLAETAAAGARTMIGEVRMAMAPDARCAEVSLSVAEAWRRQTLGAQLLEAMMHRARQAGVEYLAVDVLRSNQPATALTRKMGFAFGPPAADARLIQLVTKISPGARRACVRHAATKLM